MSEVEVSVKRKNFTDAEKDTVLALIETHRSVIECKRTDAVSNNAKEEAWNTLAQQYNALGQSKRSAKQLRLW